MLSSGMVVNLQLGVHHGEPRQEPMLQWCYRNTVVKMIPSVRSAEVADVSIACDPKFLCVVSS